MKGAQRPKYAAWAKQKKTPSPPVELSRDMYGFTIKPQYAEVYKKYSRVYEMEEEERSDQWEQFLHFHNQHFESESKSFSAKSDSNQMDLDSVIESSHSGHSGDSSQSSRNDQLIKESSVSDSQLWTNFRSLLTPVQTIIDKFNPSENIKDSEPKSEPKSESESKSESKPESESKSNSAVELEKINEELSQKEAGGLANESNESSDRTETPKEGDVAASDTDASIPSDPASHSVSHESNFRRNVSFLIDNNTEAKDTEHVGKNKASASSSSPETDHFRFPSSSLNDAAAEHASNFSPIFAKSSQNESNQRVKDSEIDEKASHSIDKTAGKESSVAGEDNRTDEDNNASTNYAKSCYEELHHLVLQGVPMAYRGELWQIFVGSKGLRVEGMYEKLLSENVNESDYDKEYVEKHMEEMNQIEKDLPRTFPGHPALDSIGRDALRNVLLAYARKDKVVGYCQGMNFLAALLLLLMPEENAFWTLVGLMENYFKGYYSDQMIEAQVDQLVLDQLLNESFPDLWRLYEELGVQFECISAPWLLSVFVNVLPGECVLRLWDIMLFERNRSMLFRVSLALIHLYENVLVQTQDPGDAMSLLQKIAGATFDSNILLCCSNFTYAEVNEPLLCRLRTHHRPSIIQMLKERELSLVNYQLAREGSKTSTNPSSSSSSSSLDTSMASYSSALSSNSSADNIPTSSSSSPIDTFLEPSPLLSSPILSPARIKFRTASRALMMIPKKQSIAAEMVASSNRESLIRHQTAKSEKLGETAEKALEELPHFTHAISILFSSISSSLSSSLSSSPPPPSYGVSNLSLTSSSSSSSSSSSLSSSSFMSLNSKNSVMSMLKSSNLASRWSRWNSSSSSSSSSPPSSSPSSSFNSSNSSHIKSSIFPMPSNISFPASSNEETDKDSNSNSNPNTLESQIQKVNVSQSDSIHLIEQNLMENMARDLGMNLQIIKKNFKKNDNKKNNNYDVVDDNDFNDHLNTNYHGIESGLEGDEMVKEREGGGGEEGRESMVDVGTLIAHQESLQLQVKWLKEQLVNALFEREIAYEKVANLENKVYDLSRTENRRQLAMKVANQEEEIARLVCKVENLQIQLREMQTGEENKIATALAEQERKLEEELDDLLSSRADKEGKLQHEVEKLKLLIEEKVNESEKLAQVLVLLQNEQRKTEDLRIVAERNVTSQKQIVRDLMEKNVGLQSEFDAMEKRALMAESTLQAFLAAAPAEETYNTFGQKSNKIYNNSPSNSYVFKNNPSIETNLHENTRPSFPSHTPKIEFKNKNKNSNNNNNYSFSYNSDTNKLNDDMMEQKEIQKQYQMKQIQIPKSNQSQLSHPKSPTLSPIRMGQTQSQSQSPILSPIQSQNNRIPRTSSDFDQALISDIDICYPVKTISNSSPLLKSFGVDKFPDHFSPEKSFSLDESFSESLQKSESPKFSSSSPKSSDPHSAFLPYVMSSSSPSSASTSSSVFRAFSTPKKEGK